jgi:hypothetical protein
MALREKLKALTAPSREVDAEIAVMFRDCPKTRNNPDHWLMRNFPPDAWRPLPGTALVAVGEGKSAVNFTSDKYTASLDATVELVERELPKVIEPEWSLETAPGGYWACFGHERCTQSGALHTLPAVALLLALLEAKEIE